MSPIEIQQAEELLAQRRWLQGLARGLVSDEARAEDVCQETLLAALSRPVEAHARRPLLARIARSFAARFGRDERRRRRREAAAAKAEAGPSAAEVVEQVATQRTVIDAVMRLDEPYRSTILLRYWEDLPPREVAKRMSAPVETVRTRLKRGLALLRERLDREVGDRKAWLMPIASFVSVGKRSFALVSGGAVVKAKLTTVAALVAVGLALTLVPWDGAGEATPEPIAEPPRAPATADGGVGGDPVPDLVRSEMRPPAVAADAADTAEEIAMLRGRVLDASAAPLAGVGVRIRGKERQVAKTDTDGWFALARPALTEQVEIAEAGWTTVLAGVVTPGETAEPVVVAAPTLGFGGVVLGPNGEPLAGAQASCTLPEDFRARFGHVLDFSSPVRWSVRAGPDGSFRLGSLGRIEGAELHFSMDGYLPVGMQQPEMSDLSMHVVLSRPTPVEGTLLGQVVDPSWVPVPEARVSLGRVATVSDGEGRFTIDMKKAGRNLEIIAMKRGYLPGTYRLREWQDEFRAADQPFATVRLGGAPLSISGELSDPEGRPVEGAKVWVQDPMVFGNLGQGLGLISVEGFLGGGMTVSELEQRYVRNGRPIMPVEQILQENPTAKWAWIKTDAAGRFRVGGLLQKAYTVSALVSDSLVRVDGGPFPAGTTNARLVIPAGAVIPVLAGRVVSHGGVPVAGVHVQTICDPMNLTRVTITADGRRSTHGSGRSETGRSTLTDEDGRFRFESVGANRVYLTLSGDQIMPTSFGREFADPERLEVERADGRLSATAPSSGGLADSGLPLDDLVIEVSLRLHLRVELADPELADRIRATDADGSTINLSIMSGDGIDSFDILPLREGRTEVLAAPESVTTLVFYKSGAEVGRLPLTLEPGRVNMIRGW